MAVTAALGEAGRREVGSPPTPRLPGARSLADEVSAHRACTRCCAAGYLPRAHPVFSLVPGARVLLVGQAPGPVEDDVTRPFAGRAGRQLMRWFERAGVGSEETVRRRVSFTSMTTCFPGRNAAGTGDRRPTMAEVRLCASWLDGALALLDPRLVIAAGGLAHLRFAPGRRLDELVGRVFDANGSEISGDPPSHGYVVVPLPHPSGQSRWLNDPSRLALLEQALARLGPLVDWAEGRRE